MRVLATVLVVVFFGAIWGTRRLLRRGHRRLALLLAVVIAAPFVVLAARGSAAYFPGPATAAVEPLVRGVSYERLVQTAPRPRVAHVVRVALDTPGLRLGATTPDALGDPLPYWARTTTRFAEETGAAAAINGDFFEPWRPGLLFGYPSPGDPVRTLGSTWSDGAELGSPDRSRHVSAAHVVLGPGAQIAFGEAPGDGADVVGGLCMLVDDGSAADLTPCRAKRPWELHPRSAIAVDRARGVLLLVVVDGRQPRYSLGAELDELAALLVELGAHQAMNLDGGGSSALVARSSDGVLRMLSSPIAERLPGRERAVANHIGVFIDP